MIVLSEQQCRELEIDEQPPVVVDSSTGQVYRLIKQEVYNTVCGILKPYNRGWDPDEDLIRKKS